MERGRKVIRTPSGAKYVVKTDELYITSGRFGERIEEADEMSEVVYKVSRDILDGVRGTIRASTVTIEFGLQYDEEGSLAVTLGRNDAHVVITMEFAAGEGIRADMP